MTQPPKKIILHKKNESFLFVEADEGVHLEIRDALKFRPPKYKYHPAFRRRHWDGYMYLYNSKTRELPLGCYWPLKAWAKKRKYELAGETPAYTPLDRADFDIFLDSRPVYAGAERIQLYEHQRKAAHMALISKRMIIESSTSSGKSLIAYTIASYLLSHGYRGLYIVPTIGLVSQLEQDFKDYIGKEKSKVIDIWMHQIFTGQEKETDKLLTVSTWQSLQYLPPDWFEKFDYVICDEVHTAQATSVKGVIEACTNAQYKIGMTGSLNESKCARSVLVGLFGPAHKIMTNAEAIKLQIASDIYIHAMMLTYDNADKYKLYSTPLPTISKITQKKTKQSKEILEFQREINFLMEHRYRNNMIVNLAATNKHTTLILTHSRDHAKLLYEKCDSACDGSCYLVYGETSPEERDEVRQFAETNQNSVIVATYGVFQQGISIKNIHNIIFATPSKSKIRVLQSIGRGLRKAKEKEHMTLYDICDIIPDGETNSDYTEGNMNYAFKHFIKRLSIYSKEKFKVIKVKIEVPNED